ncbi:crotonase/enoyl-CoA hydratase family protein [Lichenicola cladoniae]|uniref:crotonase/enoyl-CoA hydratase family protein n=1 Tax=Lichenicola cladoniae TaxID=1484109 RepID=UPI001EF471CC|nr:crotonase/enoyl-CoA hydratase family protein [Lichenicola cladoniae]
MTFINKQAQHFSALDTTEQPGASYASPIFGGSDDHHAVVDFDHLANRYDPDARTFWSMMQLRHGTVRVTPPLLRDVLSTHGVVRTLRERQIARNQDPVQYFVFGSDIPGIYNLGGDLALFADRIRERDETVLRDYAHLCIDVIFNNHVAFHQPIITIGLVQGDALGGGFESALSYDVLVAERSAKLGLPEVLFNLFPGMGAYSFLRRRLDAARAEAMIMSGRLYTGEELHAMGVVDVLAEDGEGVLTVRNYIARNSRKFNAHHALLRARRRVNAITEQELRDVVEIWVDAALQLGEPDLRKMERLVAAQRRRLMAMEPAHAVAAE